MHTFVVSKTTTKALRKLLFLLTFSLGLIFQSYGQFDRKSFEAERTTSKFKIDGILDEADWQTSSPIQNFVQRRPEPGSDAAKRTEVWFRYDDDAIYIAAKLYEDKEDLFNLLTNRDEGGNADYFGVIIDPYKAGLNGVGLFVTSAGVQRDVLYSGNRGRGDSNWNAVWFSNTQVYDDHWTVEMKIPYAVLRFKSSAVQDWGINFERSSRAINETDYWSGIDPSITGFLNQAGAVTNIKDVKAPTRLFFYPYMSTVISRSTAEGLGNPQLNGGMDVKYGINDAFTLDMTLIPDFSGVRSDNQVLNLSPFEVRFDENRQFFTEGVQLFNKAGLFYSRRIGGTSASVSNLLGENESTTSSPLAAQLINASKITGRTNSGLGIGFFNAVTDKTTVDVEDVETGETRAIEADPLTNFNVLVLDQNLPNNSSVTLTNTSVLRGNNDAITQGGNTEVRTGGGTYTRGRNIDDAMVTALNLTLFDPTLTWRVRGSVGYSQLFSFLESAEDNDFVYDRINTTGFQYSLAINKVSGNWRYGLSRRVESDRYSYNELGFQRRPNNIQNQLNLEYQQFRPKGWFNNYRFRVNVDHNQLYKPQQFGNYSARFNANGQFKNFWFAFADFGISPKTSSDFFESRVDGYIFKRPSRHNYSVNLFTDGRKPFRITARLRGSARPDWNQKDRSYEIQGRIRIGQRLEISHQVETSNRDNERGYARRLYTDEGDLDAVVFGTRDRKDLTNTLQGSYIFTNRMGLTLRVRHYWSRVEYSKFWELTDQSDLIDIDYTGIDSDTGERIHDRNFNSFNIDMEYNWQISPGSEIRAVWKRSIGTDDKNTDLNFFSNFGDTFNSPNFDTITLRFVYFLDYLNVKKIFRRN